ncbi:hypothetical protein CC86DRAFT_380059 [Ophiobolus disseminans]|uniref:Uncharacterized protein n=1 Tax=Ophiobolus disseminans TaxID=1469910 RepID=A0A6A7A853_9PLEO|nr:hypothetical protein CC86DRAFT_380059 [Ophiobolus disseminans]
MMNSLLPSFPPSHLHNTILAPRHAPNKAPTPAYNTNPPNKTTQASPRAHTQLSHSPTTTPPSPSHTPCPAKHIPHYSPVKTPRPVRIIAAVHDGRALDLYDDPAAEIVPSAAHRCESARRDSEAVCVDAVVDAASYEGGFGMGGEGQGRRRGADGVGVGAGEESVACSAVLIEVDEVRAVFQVPARCWGTEEALGFYLESGSRACGDDGEKEGGKNGVDEHCCLEGGSPAISPGKHANAPLTFHRPPTSFTPNSTHRSSFFIQCVTMNIKQRTKPPGVPHQQRLR